MQPINIYIYIYHFQSHMIVHHSQTLGAPNLPALCHARKKELYTTYCNRWACAR
ncbi:hypothetical protein GBAR_LOCUS5778 [Geodia barretti]|uniref:Uncharacterized protein n=1 Tax=Geodia barretti TaxID=519541 RepID=A0AA35RCJ3_GEOBA|nr:hypothetical protein GBAR_LOCUS5778 [Geodia barretti]